ncbi:VOC family protein [Nocardioides zeae]|uniref:VOC family protein n=1 Tax=Nocardioides imazamoxiresistens TaxID=3231893 RepID=A0ABU3PS23_9ACTN|nr:VOC family protein [Nocardioides zeae]MDT9592023.1 VOC family protein [Nocardioides zeae]
MAGIRGRTGWWGVALDSRDPEGLGRFYAALLGWEARVHDPTWVTLVPEGEGRTYLACALDEHHEPPTWPSEPGRPLMQSHLDVEVDDLDVAVADAVALGARLAVFQPQETVRVLLDPAGHPFCLYLAADPSADPSAD